MMRDQGEQFEDLVFPGMGAWGNPKRTMRAQVPKVEEGKRRIWRNSSISNPHGMWSDRPLTGYGDRMMYMDLPHDVAEQHRGGDNGKQEHYLFRDEHSRPALPGHVNQVQFTGQQDYQVSDWAEYRERWNDDTTSSDSP